MMTKKAYISRLEKPIIKEVTRDPSRDPMGKDPGPQHNYGTDADFDFCRAITKHFSSTSRSRFR